ncbi:MAG TPA: regulatory iron-sulfur-containing complex subunit RicT [Patescibacteria group bacterium]|nr:regulatory iron-sulfur-containing complex subunit RicT [Patescibacteria group bacterium]
MKVALVQFTPWDKMYAFDPKDFDLKAGDYVVVSTEYGTEVTKVVVMEEYTDEQIKELGGIKPIDRLANRQDLTALENFNSTKEKNKAINYCKKLVKRHELDMKLVDCHCSFDGQRLIFAFIAEGRVDFRGLVKELTRHFQKSIRLHQLGVRDEAKVMGDIGTCGEDLCCRGHLKKLGNVSSDLAEQQQVAHRGSERLSGICGRLKCCLAYEQDLYEELGKKLPPIGTRVRTKHGRGEIIGWHTLRGSVDVRLDPEKGGDTKQMVVEVPIK